MLICDADYPHKLFKDIKVITALLIDIFAMNDVHICKLQITNQISFTLLYNLTKPGMIFFRCTEPTMWNFM